MKNKTTAAITRRMITTDMKKIRARNIPICSKPKQILLSSKQTIFEFFLKFVKIPIANFRCNLPWKSMVFLARTSNLSWVQFWVNNVKSKHAEVMDLNVE